MNCKLCGNECDMDRHFICSICEDTNEEALLLDGDE
jgi:hypothetical protein